MTTGLRLLGRAVVLGAVGFAVTALGCTKSKVSSPSSPQFFEGVIEYRGVQGSPTPRAFGMTCSVLHDNFLCDIASSDLAMPVQMGFRGPGSTLCFRLAGQPLWIPLSMQTIGTFMSMIPEGLRRDAIQRTQAQYRFTGRAETISGRTCHVLEVRDDDNMQVNCYSIQDLFEGTPKLAAVWQQIGFDPGFVANLAQYGFAYRLQAYDRAGALTLNADAVRIDTRTMPAQTFAGVCGMP